jgi:hypothetical protein
MSIAKFKVQPRVVYLLSNQYRSSEQALKELVDNAWDADAENVHITIPLDLFTTEAICNRQVVLNTFCSLRLNTFFLRK